MNYIIGTKLGYVSAIKQIGTDQDYKAIYNAEETFSIFNAQRFASAEEAATEAKKSWLRKKEGYSIMAVLYTYYPNGYKNFISSEETSTTESTRTNSSP